MIAIDHFYSETGCEQTYLICMTAEERRRDALFTPVTGMKTKFYLLESQPAWLAGFVTELFLVLGPPLYSHAGEARERIHSGKPASENPPNLCGSVFA